MKKRKITFYISLIILVSFIIRLISSFRQELWVDEAYSIYAIKFYTFPFYDYTHPFLYFLILKFWGIISLNYLWLRALSILISVLNIWLFFKLSKLILNNNKFALLSTSLLAVSAFHIHYSWQIRPYSLYFLLTTLSLYFFVTILKKIEKKELIQNKIIFAFFITNLLGTLVAFGFLLYLTSLFLFSLFWILKNHLYTYLKKTKLLFFCFFAHLTVIPLIVYFLTNQKSGNILSLINWIKMLSFKEVLFIFLNLSNIATIKTHQNLFLFVAMFFILILIFSYSLTRLKKNCPQFFFLSIFLITLPFLLSFIFQLIFSVSIAQPRTLLFIHIPLNLLFSLAIYYSWPKKRKIKIFKTAILVIAFLILIINLFINLETNFKNFYNDQGYRKAVLNIKKEIRPNDKILILPTYFRSLFWYYWEDFKDKQTSLYQTTEFLEKNLYNPNADWLQLKKLSENDRLLVVVNNHSVLSTKEKEILINLHNFCQRRILSSQTEVIYCSKTNLEKL